MSKFPFEITSHIQGYLEDILYLRNEWRSQAIFYLIKKDKNGYMQFELLEDGKLIHTHDHEILTIKIGKYVQIPERELDHFSNSVARNVVD